MGAAAPMRQVARLGRFRLFHAGPAFVHRGLILWTGRGHRQVWPPTFRRAD